jgi:NTE family protein
MKTPNKPGNYQSIAMACQGGGSLGAYHIGALQAMEEAHYSPDIVAGISIGAFTAAIIAGNAPENRVARLREFWQAISWPGIPGVAQVTNVPLRRSLNTLSSMQGFLFGQPQFFTPRFPGPQFEAAGTPAAESYYNTTWLRQTLCRFVDFDGINNGTLSRLLLGAARVKDGQQVFFDSATTCITPDHVIASGAMPPGFAGIRIDGDLYWDGGCLSNTPLEGIFNIACETDTLCFMVDLFGSNGHEPQTMDEVTLKIKELQFASRTDQHIAQVQQRHNLACALKQTLNSSTDKGRAGQNAALLQGMGMSNLEANTRFDIVHIVYDKPAYEIATCDCEFSRASILDRAQRGHADMRHAIAQSPWLSSAPTVSLLNNAADKSQAASGGSAVHKFVGCTHVSSCNDGARTSGTGSAGVQVTATARTGKASAKGSGSRAA